MTDQAPEGNGPLVVYIEDERGVRAAMPKFVEKVLPPLTPEVGGYTLQWPAGMVKDEKAELFAAIMAAIDYDALTVLPRIGETSRDAMTSFIESIDSDEWWLGDVALLVSSKDSVMAIFPGSDGAFLHFVAHGKLGPLTRKEIADSAPGIEWQ